MAYIYDYYLVYKFILALLNYNERYYTLSIGCGAMIDKIGFKYAACEIGSSNAMYIGADKASWNNEQISNFYKGIFIKSDIGNVKRNRFLSKIGIIFFPRSLSEVQYSSLTKFINRLHADNFHDHICIASVPVSMEQDKFAKEEKKLLCFTKAVSKKFKFSFSAVPDNKIFTSKKPFYDQCYKNNFKYPTEIRNWILKMEHYCIESCKNKEEKCKFIWKDPAHGLPSYNPMIYQLTK